MMWCTIFLRRRLSFSLCPSCSFLPHLPRLKENKQAKNNNNNKAPFFFLYPSLLPSPIPSLLLTGLSLPISRHLHLFFLPESICLPHSPSLSISFHRSLFFSVGPPPTHTHTYMPTALSLKTQGLPVYLFRPNTYTRQYFFSCYSPHIFYAIIPLHFVLSVSPCLLPFHPASFLQSFSPS